MMSKRSRLQKGAKHGATTLAIVFASESRCVLTPLDRWHLLLRQI